MYGYKVMKKDIFSDDYVDTNMVDYEFADADGAREAGIKDVDDFSDKISNCLSSIFKVVTFEEMNGAVIEGTEKEFMCE